MVFHNLQSLQKVLCLVHLALVLLYIFPVRMNFPHLLLLIQNPKNFRRYSKIAEEDKYYIQESEPL
ncbi:hypothetical protein D3C87_1195650 [compost metagenome]